VDAAIVVLFGGQKGAGAKLKDLAAVGAGDHAPIDAGRPGDFEGIGDF